MLTAQSLTRVIEDGAESRQFLVYTGERHDPPVATNYSERKQASGAAGLGGSFFEVHAKLMGVRGQELTRASSRLTRGVEDVGVHTQGLRDGTPNLDVFEPCCKESVRETLGPLQRRFYTSLSGNRDQRIGDNPSRKIAVRSLAQRLEANRQPSHAGSGQGPRSAWERGGPGRARIEIQVKGDRGLGCAKGEPRRFADRNFAERVRRGGAHGRGTEGREDRQDQLPTASHHGERREDSRRLQALPNRPRKGQSNRMRVALPMLFAVTVAGCGEQRSPFPELPAAVSWESRSQRVEGEVGPLVMAHGGQGSPASRSTAVAKAVSRAWEVLERGGDAKKSVIAGTVVMEDDKRFNAGTGANVRLDGKTVECDAAIMDWTGDFGAVAGVRGFKNPILIAEAVASSPHLLVAGEGGIALGRRLGLEAGAEPSEQARAKLARAIAARGGPDPAWERLWNFDTPYADAITVAPPQPAEGDAVATKDTVGVIARDGQGRYAAALSTGGTSTALLGRVGDVPQYGQGLFAGPCGAVAATGKGEAIIRERVASKVYELLCAGLDPDESIRRATWNIGSDEGVGVVAISERGYGARATSQMAWAARSPEGSVQADRIVERDRGKWIVR